MKKQTALSEFLKQWDVQLGKIINIRFIDESVSAYLKINNREPAEYYIEKLNVLSIDHIPYVRLTLHPIDNTMGTSYKHLSILEAEDLPIFLNEKIFVGEEINGDGKLMAIYIDYESLEFNEIENQKTEIPTRD